MVSSRIPIDFQAACSEAPQTQTKTSTLILKSFEE